jgi:hypothetical protein
MIPSSRNECRKFKQGRRRRAREGIVLIMTLCEHRADDYDASWSSDLPTPSPRPFLMPFFAGRRKSEGGSETLRPLSRTPNEEPRVSPRNELSRGRIAREFSRGAVGEGGGIDGGSRNQADELDCRDELVRDGCERYETTENCFRVFRHFLRVCSCARARAQMNSF